MRKEENGDVVVNEVVIGTINGFVFQKHDSAEEAHFTEEVEGFILNNLEQSIDAMIGAGDAALRIENDFTMRYHGHVVASLKKTENIFSPDLDILVDERVQGLPLARLALHIQSRLKRQINLALDPLELLGKIEEPSDAVKEFVVLMIQTMGCLGRKQADSVIKKLSADDKAKLRKLGVRFAQYSVFLRDILKPMAQETKLILWALSEGFESIPEAPPAGVVSLPYDASLPKGYYDVTGYRVCNEFVIRADMIEKLADTLRPLAQKSDANPEGQFEVTPQHMSLIGKSGEIFDAVLKHLGYDFITKEVTVTSFAPAEKTEENSEEVKSEEAVVEVAADAEQTEASSVDVTDSTIEKKIWFWRGFKASERPANKNFLRRDNGNNKRFKKADGDNTQNAEGDSEKKFKKPFVKREGQNGNKRKDGRKFDDIAMRQPKKTEPTPYVNMPGKHKVSQENNPFAVLASLRKE